MDHTVIDVYVNVNYVRGAASGGFAAISMNFESNLEIKHLAFRENAVISVDDAC